MLNKLYHRINNRFPLIGRILRRVYTNKPVNRITKTIKGSGNTISYKGSILNSVIFDIVGNNNSIIIKNNSELNKVLFYIRGNGHSINIGEKTIIFDDTEIVFEDNNGVLNIGQGSRFWGTHIAVTEDNSKITIGQNCSIAYDVDIRTGDSHSIISNDTNKRINYAKDVIIGNRVWIAAHNTILKGVTIQNDSVVATGSIVTKNFKEKNVIIAGNPAKIIKRNISWSRERLEQ